MLALIGLAFDPWDGFQTKLEEIRVRADLPGIAAATIGAEGEATVHVAGIRKVGEKEPVLRGDKWHLGSCTKAMTAAVISTLVAEKKLNWTDTIGGSFPELKVDASFKDVTLRELLSMLGGFDPNIESWWPYEKETNDLRKQRMMAITDALKAPAEKAKRGTFSYTNVGLVIAGTMAERKANQTIESLLTDRMAKPLGMKSIGFGPTGKGQPWPHDKGKPATDVQDNPAVMTAAGRVHMSMSDWAKFAQSIVRRMRDESSPWPQDLKTELESPPADQPYAMGWIRTERPWGGGRVYTHGGSNNLNQCLVWIAPKTGRAYLVATNVVNDKSNSALDSVIADMIQRFSN